MPRTRITQSFPTQIGGSGQIPFPQRRKDYMLVSLCFVVNTGPTVGNRIPRLTVFDGALNNLIIIEGYNIAASSGSTICMAAGLSMINPPNQNLTQTIPLPWDLWIKPQWIVSWGIAGVLDATDQIAGSVIQTESLDEPTAKPPRQRPSGQDAP